jgi:hypothetical protein
MRRYGRAVEISIDVANSSPDTHRSCALEGSRIFLGRERDLGKSSTSKRPLLGRACKCQTCLRPPVSAVPR